MIKRQKPIPESKIKEVKNLTDLIKNKKTILIASIKNLPASQYQEIGKKLRGKAIIKVPKRNLFFRAIDESKDEAIKILKEQFKNSIAILFSDLDSYELAGELLKNKSPAKAKPGQEAPEDIEIQAGPTDLPPGPAISELGAVGLQVQIENGKITIREPKVIVKAGEKISKEAADIMNKLDIKPFSIGFIPLCAFDKEKEKLYLEIKINPEEAIQELKGNYSKALSLAINIGYANEETIKFLIGKAGINEKILLESINKNKDVKEKTEKKPESEKPAQDSQNQTPEENKTESKEVSGEEK